MRISVSKGRFATVEEGAGAEDQVRWFSPDPAAVADAYAVSRCYAAVELRDGLRQLYDHAQQPTPEIVFAEPTGDAIEGELTIYLGAPDSHPAVEALARGGELESLGEDGYLILAGGSALKRTLTIAALGRKGLLNGVYGYLGYLGLGWASPDQPQAAWPQQLTPWIRGLCLRETPAFRLRGFLMPRPGERPELPLLWMARNRMNMAGPRMPCPAYAKKLGMTLMGGGHVFEELFDPELEVEPGVTLFQAHPDWFAMRDGVRVPARGHACMSNPEAVEYLLDRATERILEKGQTLDVYRFWPLDVWQRWCECPDCLGQGNDADRYLELIHALRQRLGAAYEAGRIDHRPILFFIVYEGSGIYPPPTCPLPEGFDQAMNWMEVWPINRCYAHRQADPECLEFNRHYWRDLQGWLEMFDGTVVMGEYYNVSKFSDLATVFSRVMFADVQDYVEAGISGLQYMHAAAGCWGTRSLTNWQLAQLQWDSNREYDGLLRTFFALRYGPLGEEMEKHYSLLDRAMSNLSVIKSWIAGSLSRRLQHVYADNMADRSTEQLFVYDHLRLHRAEGSDGTIGYGYDNLDDIMAALYRVRGALRKLLGGNDLSPVVRANLEEDLWQVEYTLEFLALHHEFARYWEANRTDSGDPERHRRRILELADSLAATEVPELASTKPEIRRNALVQTDLREPLKKAFEYGL